VTVRSKRLVPVHGWLYASAASGPIGGGLIKLGHGSNWAAVGVGVAPYAICALLYSVFMIGYLAAVLRYLFSGPAGQQSMERLITVSANAIVSVLTLTGHAPRPTTQPTPIAHCPVCGPHAVGPRRNSRNHTRAPVPPPRTPGR
jgi:hypothetical protein